MSLFFIVIMVLFSITAAFSNIGEDTTSSLLHSSFPSTKPLTVYGSAFYTYGSYCTGTNSKNTNAFITLDLSKKSYYTAGYQTISFSRDDAGDNYFIEYTIFGKALWWFSPYLNASVYYAYDHQNEIAYYAPQFTFHVFGAGTYYWINKNTALGASYSGATQASEMTTTAFQGTNLSQESEYAVHNATASLVHSFAEGLWFSTSAILTDAKWAGTFFYVRENISYELGKAITLKASAGFGRRAFYLDEDLLLLFDQPDVQKGGFSFTGIISVTKNISIIPAVEYDLFDEYNISYGSCGLKVSF